MLDNKGFTVVFLSTMGVMDRYQSRKSRREQEDERCQGRRLLLKLKDVCIGLNL